MDSHDRMLAAFVAGDLGMADARRWDEHLLECERCWRAVREDGDARRAAERLRLPPPPGLADQVRFAVELAAAAGTSPCQPGRRRGSPTWVRLAVGGAAVVAFLVVALVFVPSAGHGGVPPTVAAVARYARALPPPGTPLPVAVPPGRPAEVGHQVSVTAGGHRITLRTWRLGGVEAVVATSSHPFPMPPGARGASGTGMAWSARLGTVQLYCVNGRQSELVAAPVPAAELARLAARLPRA